MNSITNLTPKLREAADIQEKIQELREELDQILGSDASTPAQATQGPRKKWKVSAAGRARMRAAQLARWAAIKAARGEPVKKARRKMSAQGLANIRAGVKARWAKVKKAGNAML
jgi:hypothetical protein